MHKRAHLQLLCVHVSAERAQHPVALPLSIVALRPELLQSVQLVAVGCQMVTVRFPLLPVPAGAAGMAWGGPILAPAPCRTGGAPTLHCRSVQSHVCDAVR